MLIILLSTRRRGSLLFSIPLLVLMIASCSSPIILTQEENSKNQATQPLLLPSASPTEKPAKEASHGSPIRVNPTPTLKASSTPTIDVRLRVTYLTSGFADPNEIVQSRIWAIYPPDDSPKLLFTAEKGNQNEIISDPSWAHDGRRVAFAHLVGDENHFAYSVLDTATNEVSQISDVTEIDRPFESMYEAKWSFDDSWLYLAEGENFFRGRIINSATKEQYELPYRTQDELEAWSPVVAGQYVSISRKNFPDSGGDVLCLNKVGEIKPLKCFADFSNYTLLSGNTFSWSTNGEKGLIVAGTNSETYTYILLDFTTMEWEPILLDDYYELQDYWSPDGKWVVFYYYKSGINLLEMDTETRELRRVSDSEYPQPLGWLLNGQWMVYRDGYAVYAAKPTEPSDSRLIEDFSESLKEKIPYFQIELLRSTYVTPP